jgi:hypothetical protein
MCQRAHSARTVDQLYVLFSQDKGFSNTLFRRQMSVMRGQVRARVCVCACVCVRVCVCVCVLTALDCSRPLNSTTTTHKPFLRS